MRLLFSIGLVFTLAGCSGGLGSVSSLNPFNLFRGSGVQKQSATQTLAPRSGYTFASDTRPLVDQITAFSVEKTTTGVIVRATALTPAEGFFNAGLVPATSTNPNELVLQFRARPPGQRTRIGPVHLREITAALAFSTAQLQGIQRITVSAAQNSRTLRP